MNKYYYGVRILRVIPIMPKRSLMVHPTIEHIAMKMRAEDKREIMAQGKDPKEELVNSLLSSCVCYIAYYGDEPLAAFGVADNYGETSIWMLGAENVSRHVKALVSGGMDFIREQLEEHKQMSNYISLRNKKALRFIKHAGAEINNTPVVTENGTKFVKFTLRRKPCAVYQQP